MKYLEIPERDKAKGRWCLLKGHASKGVCLPNREETMILAVLKPKPTFLHLTRRRDLVLYFRRYYVNSIQYGGGYGQMETNI